MKLLKQKFKTVRLVTEKQISGIRVLFAFHDRRNFSSTCEGTLGRIQIAGYSGMLRLAEGFATAGRGRSIQENKPAQPSLLFKSTGQIGRAHV